MKKSLTPFIDREISWLEFNGRVLQEAADERNPLIERVKFLGIFSSNLDEFYRVRVATLSRLRDLKDRKTPIPMRNPGKILKEINRIDKRHQKEFAAIFRKLTALLAEEGIRILNEHEITPEQGKFIHSYFNENVRSHLFPILLPNVKLSALADMAIYLAIHLRRKDNQADERYAVMKMPVGQLPRFIILPPAEGSVNIILLDDVIRYSLKEIFAVMGYDDYRAYTFKFTRDAEMDIDNDVSKSFLEIMVESLKQRKTGAAVRFVYDRKMPLPMLQMLKERLEISEDDTIIKGGRYHNFKDFMAFPDIGRPDLEYSPMPALMQKLLPQYNSIFNTLKARDLMLHTPYQSFRYILDLLREASIDPEVRAIKMTIYRVASNSNVINALINASRNGKAVTVFMELQARFDEEANIYWAGKLQESGVKLIQGTPGFKVHSKLLLIHRKENSKNIFYANIGTGNFNEQTARLYADDSLLTSNQDIAQEVNSIFHLFESKFKPPKFKHLVVAPFNMRDYFMKLLNNEIRNARAGKDAWCIIKLNNLADERLVKKLYQAGREGVKIDIICRSTCVMVPGIPGISDNIRIISIVDRFLEHSRVLIFANGGNELYYTSSADWMRRNLDARIEVACPIYNKELQHELMTMIRIQLKDNIKARLVNHNPPNEYVPHGEPAIRAQVEIYKNFK
jgi:polyphosphate kinase